jgi:hypothetical protein
MEWGLRGKIIYSMVGGGLHNACHTFAKVGGKICTQFIIRFSIISFGVFFLETHPNPNWFTLSLDMKKLGFLARLSCLYLMGPIPRETFISFS